MDGVWKNKNKKTKWWTSLKKKRKRKFELL